MSTTPRQYLYTAEDIYGKDALDEGMSRDEIWHAYEAARAKDAELIQRLVDAISYSRKHGPPATLSNCHWDIALHNALSDAAAAGFKPSEP